MNSQNRQLGLTLIELIVVLAVVAILVAFASPGLQSLLQNNQIVSQTNQLVSGLHLARSEAVKRNAEVEVCGSSDGSDCDGEWAEGWIVKIREPREDEEDVLLTGSPAQGTLLESDVGGITYQGDGIAKPGDQPSVIRLINASFKREVEVSMGGSVRSCNKECDD